MEKPKTIQGSASSSAQNAAPRPRVRLPEAMRAAGVDEHFIAESVAAQFRRLKKGGRSKVPGKLLLDYLKECIRILFAPARRGTDNEQPTTVELVHFVPRPDRSNDKPPGENSS